MSDRTTAGDLDADRTVYHAGRAAGQNTMIHLSRSCRLLTQGKRDYSDRAGALFDDRPVCSKCTGEGDHGGLEPGQNASETQQKLADMDPEDLGLSPSGERAVAGEERGSL